MFIFGMALIIATTFFYINHARMDDFTSLITDTTIQYQEEGAMKDYTADVELKDNTGVLKKNNFFVGKIV